MWDCQAQWALHSCLAQDGVEEETCCCLLHLSQGVSTLLFCIKDLEHHWMAEVVRYRDKHIEGDSETHTLMVVPIV